jgi:hypothetical protein
MLKSNNPSSCQVILVSEKASLSADLYYEEQ